MSWQTYVDDHLMCEIDGQYLSSAAIIGHDGSVWAQSSSFPQVYHWKGVNKYDSGLKIKIGGSLLNDYVTTNFNEKELTAIMNDFEEPGSLAPTGLFLGGIKYMVIQGEPGVVIRGKKGSGGICIKKTNMALIIGIYEEPMAPGQCNMIVERLGDYLVEQGM